MRWDYERIDTDEEYARLYGEAQMRRWPKCTRVVKAMEDMGYTDICLSPGFIEAVNPMGVWIGIDFGQLRGYHRLLAPFAYNINAAENPHQGPPKKPPPPPFKLTPGVAFDAVFPP